MKKCALLMTLVSLVVNGVWAVTVLDPSIYQVETYASWAACGLADSPIGTTVDDLGNVYVGQFTDSVGQIIKVDSCRNVSTWIDGVGKPLHMRWTNDPDYGQNLYVAYRNLGPEQIARIDLNGNIDTFAITPDASFSLDIDKNGIYGGGLFVGSRDLDNIYHVNAAGSVSLFSEFPLGTVSPGHRDLGFDPTSKYGGLMYVMINNMDYEPQGIFAIDVNGNATSFADDIVKLYDIEFDPVGTMFNNDLFTFGRKDDTEGYFIYRIDPSGNSVPFARRMDAINNFVKPAMTFGPDGAMYVTEYSADTNLVTVSRITTVPEPATLTLLTVGAVGLLRRRKC